MVDDKWNMAQDRWNPDQDKWNMVQDRWNMDIKDLVLGTPGTENPRIFKFQKCSQINKSLHKKNDISNLH